MHIKWFDLTANLIIIVGIPIVVIMALDRYRKDWRGGRYYWLATALMVLIDAVLFFSLYGMKGLR